MKKLILLVFAVVCLSSCSTTRHNPIFYKGYVIKSNGERKQKTFIFGRDACVRKNKRMARRRAAKRSFQRNPNYGVTSMGRARQQ